MSLGVRAYQVVISPTLHALAGPGCGCRFTPSCSHYALEALALHGPVRGTALAARRILRCHPWGPYGQDPVPAPRATKAASPSLSA
ncbi:MAG: membrane protein insertion efficiency factor YidD [Verrucomicrobia bacterium]|nr:MAG: membrane protein insertion efficiency factor YidD [Verrucomicrobiota bacterium]